VPALEAGGLSQVLSLAEYLTPGIMKTISDLIRDWADDKLDTKVFVHEDSNYGGRLMA
jgi:hypothetical protein